LVYNLKLDLFILITLISLLSCSLISVIRTSL